MTQVRIKTCILRAKTFQYSHLFNHCKPLYVHSPRTFSKKVTNISNLEHKNVPLHLDEHLAPMNRLHLQSFTLCLFIARISDSFLPQKNQQKGTHRNILQLLLIFCPQPPPISSNSIQNRFHLYCSMYNSSRYEWITWSQIYPLHLFSGWW